MRSYLSLIPISAKVRRRQNRMTILCIIFSVFLVTAVFSLADMMIRTESSFMLNKHGNWHYKLEHISEETAEEILSRPDVAAAGAASVFNYDGSESCWVGEKKAVLYGTEEIYMEEIFDGITEGHFPKNDQEVILSPNAAAAWGAEVGDRVVLHTPSLEAEFTVSGLGCDDEEYYANQTYLIGVYMTKTAFSSLMEQNGVAGISPVWYVQFQDIGKAAGIMEEIRETYQLPEEQISENTGVMGMAGQSQNESAKNWYGLAAVLFVLVLLSGVLMISGSMNSNIAQRTQFFGMMRCIGASRRQIIRFVRLEALNWCKSAVPAGLVLGTLVNWGICGLLHYGIGGEFATTPVFRISPAGLILGAAVGVVTVLLAARSPARHAAKVSPVSAVSGSMENTVQVCRAARTGRGKIEYSLGIHHAASAKKNWCLMTASIALIIILLLTFSVVMDMMRLLLPSMNVTTADMALTGYGNAMVFDRELTEEIRRMEGVESVYGSSYLDQIPAESSNPAVDRINIVSYDDTLLSYAAGSISEGSLDEVFGDHGKAATVFNQDNPLRVGDTIVVGGEEITISCALSQGLFGDGLIVICSQETFDRLMGAHPYNLIGIQLKGDVPDETVAAIRNYENDQVIVTDERESNRTDKATYWASRIVCYGFLLILGTIALFSIMNSISMSVSARIRQYGAMRAVGMTGKQLTRMIFAEAATYVISGLIAGCGVGLPLSRYLYTLLVTSHFGIAWTLPVPLLAAAVIFAAAAAILSVRAPARRICHMSITDIINEL